jgi:hypothetical protein
MRAKPAPEPVRRWQPLRVLVAACTVVAVAGGSYLLGEREGRQHVPPAARAGAVTTTVYNIEGPCQSQRILECALGVFRAPQLGDQTTLVDRVWHGDTVTLQCVRTNGKLVADETGVSSRRWYMITVRGTGAQGWLPGVRVRNSREVPECPAQ